MYKTNLTILVANQASRFIGLDPYDMGIVRESFPMKVKITKNADADALSSSSSS
jgi:hypothetical protein